MSDYVIGVYQHLCHWQCERFDMLFVHLSAPSGVKGPISVRPLSGSEIEVIWEEPQATYGLLTKFVVMAYDNGTVVSLDINDVSVTAGILLLEIGIHNIHELIYPLSSKLQVLPVPRPYAWVPE